MRIVVMGSGGTGGFFGAKLARAGEDVTFVARGEHLAKIRGEGLRVRSAVEGEWVVKSPAHERLEGQPPADIVLFCVKSFDTETAAEVIRPVVGPDTGVLSIQNGVDNEDTLARVLGAGHVMGGMAQVFATIDGPGLIRHVTLGRMVFGEMDGHETPRARAFLAACQRAQIPSELSKDVTRTLWEKYAFLNAHAGATAVTRCPVGTIRSLPEGRELYRRLLDEMVAIARAAGVRLADDYAASSMKMVEGMAPGFASSLLFDLSQGKRIELDSLHGHAVRLGERHGVPTPTLFAVYAALLPHLNGRPPAAA